MSSDGDSIDWQVDPNTIEAEESVFIDGKPVTTAEPGYDDRWYQYGGPGRDYDPFWSTRIGSEPTLEPVVQGFGGKTEGNVSVAHEASSSELYLSNNYSEPVAFGRYDPEAGEFAWTTSPDWMAFAYYTGPCLSENNMIVGNYAYDSAPGVSSDSYLAAFDRETGDFKWIHDEREGRGYADFYSPPFVDDGRVFASYTSVGQSCLDAETGDEIWHYDGFPDGEYFWTSPPSIISGTYTVGGEVEGVYGLDPETGAEKWVNRNFTTDAGPAGGNGVIVYPVYTDGSPLVGFDAETGDVLWRTDNYPSVNGKDWGPFSAGAITRPAYRDGTVYCASYSNGNITSYGTVVAVDAQTGEWRTAEEQLYPIQSQYDAIDYKPLTLTGGGAGVVWVPIELDADSKMLFIGLDGETLDELWRFESGLGGNNITNDELTPAPGGGSYLLGGGGSNLFRVVPGSSAGG